MIVKLTAHPDQIRWWVQSALNAFDTLDAETATDIAKAELLALLAYLDRTDDAVTVLGVKAVEPGIRNELDVGKDERRNPPNLEIVRP